MLLFLKQNIKQNKTKKKQKRKTNLKKIHGKSNKHTSDSTIDVDTNITYFNRRHHHSRIKRFTRKNLYSPINFCITF